MKKISKPNILIVSSNFGWQNVGSAKFCSETMFRKHFS